MMMMMMMITTTVAWWIWGCLRVASDPNREQSYLYTYFYFSLDFETHDSATWVNTTKNLHLFDSNFQTVQLQSFPKCANFNGKSNTQWIHSGQVTQGSVLPMFRCPSSIQLSGVSIAWTFLEHSFFPRLLVVLGSELWSLKSSPYLSFVFGLKQPLFIGSAKIIPTSRQQKGWPKAACHDGGNEKNDNQRWFSDLMGSINAYNQPGFCLVIDGILDL